jgi:hypothetical protein
VAPAEVGKIFLNISILHDVEIVQWQGREEIPSLFLTFLESLVFDKGFLSLLSLENNLSAFWAWTKLLFLCCS